MSLKNRLIQAFVACAKPKTKISSSQKKFLVLSTTGLGDTLWGTPALNALRSSFPQSYIGLMTTPLGKELLSNNPAVDEFFTVGTPALPSLLKLYPQLKKKGITHVLLFHCSQRVLLPFAALLGAEVIVGTEGLNKGLDSLLTHPLKNLSQHEIERRLAIVNCVGAEGAGSAMEIQLTHEELDQASKWLLSKGIFSPFIVFHPGAKDLFKQWPPSHFSALGSRLARDFGRPLLITGSSSETKLTEQIAAKIEGAFAVTDLSVRNTAAILSLASLMITNDTGPMHLGFSLKTPTIALFSPTRPELCGPYGIQGEAVVIAKPSCCTPCLKKRCPEPFCMEQIGVDEVYIAAKTILER